MKLTREQVLLTLGFTALLLLLVAQGWSWIAQIPVVPGWQGDGLAIVVGIAVGGGLSALSGLAYYLWPQFQTVTDEYLALVMSPLRPWDMLWLGLLPGLSEEILFRGVVLTSWGLLTSSLLFGVLHLLDWRYWPYGLWAMGVGLILGFAMLSSGNLLIPVIAHITNNWLAGWFWSRRVRG